MPFQQYKRSFYRSDLATEFVYDTPYEWGRDIGEERIDHRIYTSVTPGGDGEYQESDTPFDKRLFEATGTINATTPIQLQGFLDTLFNAHPKNQEGKLFRRIMDTNGTTVLSSRYLPCRVLYRVKGPETGLLYNKWRIGFEAASSLYLDETVQNQTLVTNGTTTFTPGGTETTLPVFSFVVTTAGVSFTGNTTVGSATITSVSTTTNITVGQVVTGTGFPAGTTIVSFVPATSITLSNVSTTTATGTSFLAAGIITIGATGAASNCVLSIGATGTYIIDSSTRPRKVTLSGVSQLGSLTGQFLELLPTSQSVTVTLSGGVAVSSASVAYQRRWPFA